MLYHHIYPIFNGSFSLDFGESLQAAILDDIHCFVFLIVDEQDDLILVDTGFSPDYIPGLNSQYQKPPATDLQTAISRLGFSIEDVRKVVMTHLHWDHTGSMQLFPQAKFYVQADELRALSRLNPNEETYYCPDHWLPLLSQMEILDGDYTLRPGIELIYTGGHTAGHQMVKVETRNGPVILAGDTFSNYDFFWQAIPEADWHFFRNGPGKKYYWHEGLLTSIEQWICQHHGIESQHENLDMTAIKKQGSQMVISHDPRLLKCKLIP